MVGLQRICQSRCEYDDAEDFLKLLLTSSGAAAASVSEVGSSSPAAAGLSASGSLASGAAEGSGQERETEGSASIRSLMCFYHPFIQRVLAWAASWLVLRRSSVQGASETREVGKVFCHTLAHCQGEYREHVQERMGLEV